MTVQDLIDILETYNSDTPIVIQNDTRTGDSVENIDGIEEVEFNGKLAIQII